MKSKICVMLVCLAFVATVTPTVSATADTLSTVDDEDIYVIANGYNHTAADISELLGISLNKDSTLYISYYNLTEVLTHTSFAAYEDSTDVVWFDVDITDINLTNKLVFFDDEVLTTAKCKNAKQALLVNESYSKTDFIFIVTIPDGVEYEYDDNVYTYDEDNAYFSVLDDDGDEVSNITSYNYSSTYTVYGMNLSDEDSSHQLVFTGTDPHKTATAATGKRVTAAKWYWFDDYTTYSMSTESTADYNLFTSEDGYVAFDVYKDTGMFSTYYGKTAFRMTSDSLKYETTPWYKFWGHDWTAVTAHESTIKGIKIGIIEYIYLSEDTGAEDNNEILKDNYGVITSKGAATTVSGLDILWYMTSRTPDAVVDTGKATF